MSNKGNVKGNHSQLKPFVKGDPRINRKGRPKQAPKLKALMDAILGLKEGEEIEGSKIAQVIQGLFEEATSAKKGARTNAARELLDRMYGKVKPSDEVEEKPMVVWNETKVYKK